MKLFPLTQSWMHVSSRSERTFTVRSVVAAGVLSTFLSPLSHAQQPDSSKPAVVQPGAPGTPSKTLPSSTHHTNSAALDFRRRKPSCKA